MRLLDALTRTRRPGMGFVPKLFYSYRRFLKRLAIFLAIAGPGIIVLVADNDAGGITTYTVSGARYGYNLLWVVLLMFPMVYYIQEMTVRIGAVTKLGHAESVFQGFGRFWGWFLMADLGIVNWLTLVTEYIGMTTALRVLHVPPVVTVAVAVILLTVMVVTGRYWTFEKLALVFCLFNFLYIPAAILAKPVWADVARSMVHPVFPGGLGAGGMMIIVAVVGTTITPWQIVFQQSSVVDKGLDEKDIPFARLDTLFGSIFTCVVTAMIMICGGAAFHYRPDPQVITDAAQAAQMLAPVGGRVAGVLFAVGLFNAGLLGAICLSLSSSWAIGEVFGWAHSLNRKVREAPWFYVTYFLILATSGAVVLIPRAPLVEITLFVQVVAITLLPASLVFMMLILNDRQLMGNYANSRTQNVIDWTITLAVIILSTMFGLSVLFPKFFGGG
jgi:Mn2+/Fe2+ NRAMP family transporter